MIQNLLKKYKLLSIIIGAVNIQISLLLIVALVFFFEKETYTENSAFAIGAFLMVIVLTVFSLLLLIGAARLKELSEENEKRKAQTHRRLEAIRKSIAG